MAASQLIQMQPLPSGSSASRIAAASARPGVSPAWRWSHQYLQRGRRLQLHLLVRVVHLREDVGAHGGGQRFEERANGGQRSLVSADEIPVGLNVGEVSAPWASADDGDVSLFHARSPYWAGALVVKGDVDVELPRLRVPPAWGVGAAGWSLPVLGKSVAFRSHDGQEELPCLAVRHVDADMFGRPLGLEAGHLFAAEGNAHHARREPG